VDRKKKTKPTIDIKEIEQKLRKIARSWRDDLYENILNYFGEEEGNRLNARYLRAFPAGYRETYDSSLAIYDIKHLEKLSTTHDLELSTYRVPDTEPNNLRFKLYRFHNAIPLSEVLPILENLGLSVVGEQPYEITYPDGIKAWINDFNMYYDKNEILKVDEIKDIFQEAFSRIWYKDAENDGFNRLVLAAKINWREVTVLRTYTKFLRQIGFTFSQPYIEETFYNNPKVAKLIIDLFNARFNPNLIPEKETIHEL
jgi:glutamate dehydrogenase